MTSKQNKIKWAVTTVARPKNQIISSDAVANNIKSFTPSFEKECEVNMNYLLSNEYQRIWFAERGEYQRTVYQTRDYRPSGSFKKRIIPRAKPKSNIREIPIISLKRFENIPAKVDTGRCKQTE